MIVNINIIQYPDGFKIVPDNDFPTSQIGWPTIKETQNIIEKYMFSASVWQLKKVSEVKYQIID